MARPWFAVLFCLATPFPRPPRSPASACRRPASGPTPERALRRSAPDGRYVVFVSAATNLVAGDTNAVADIFVQGSGHRRRRHLRRAGCGRHDRLTPGTEAVRGRSAEQRPGNLGGRALRRLRLDGDQRWWPGPMHSSRSTGSIARPATSCASARTPRARPAMTHHPRRDDQRRRRRRRVRVEGRQPRSGASDLVSRSSCAGRPPVGLATRIAPGDHHLRPSAGLRLSPAISADGPDRATRARIGPLTTVAGVRPRDRTETDAGDAFLQSFTLSASGQEVIAERLAPSATRVCSARRSSTRVRCRRRCTRPPDSRRSSRLVAPSGRYVLAEARAAPRLRLRHLDPEPRVS